MSLARRQERQRESEAEREWEEARASVDGRQIGWEAVSQSIEQSIIWNDSYVVLSQRK